MSNPQDSADWSAIRRLENEEQLRAIIGFPSEIVQSKISDRLNGLTRQWVERSPFLCLATRDATGRCDVSPRGDAAGFVRILDERTLLLPDRPGNKLADSLRNILQCPQVALIFLIPGVDDTLRVNGRAWITDDGPLLKDSAVEGKVPRLGIVIETEEVYTQCGKAFLRSKLWQPDQHQSRSSLPTSGEIMASLRGESFDAVEYDRERADRYQRRDNFY